MKNRLAIQFERTEEIEALRKKLIENYPGEKIRKLYSRALVAGMKAMIEGK